MNSTHREGAGKQPAVLEAERSRRTRVDSLDCRQPLDSHGDSLARYLQELQRQPLLSPEQELEMAREIERREHEHWRALFSYPAGLEVVEQVVALRLPGAPAQLLRQRELCEPGKTRQFKRAIEGAAQVLRELDFGQGALHEADAAVHVALAEDSGARRYLARVAQAKRAAELAKGRFVAANLRLVVSMASRYKQHMLPLSDLIQEGNLGLMRAVDRYDYRRGLRFSTYAAWWIRHSLNRALSDKGRIVRVPVHALDDATRVARLRKAALSKTGVAPNNAELAEQLGMAQDKLERLDYEVVTRRPVSLDSPVRAGSEQPLHELLPAAEPYDPVETLAKSAWRQGLPQLLGTLTSIEAAVLRFRFGLDGGEELTLREIGLKYNLSRERIRQIQEQAFAKLRSTLERADEAAEANGAAA